MGEKRMYICMCDWVTLLYSGILTEHCKPAIMEKIKIVIKKKIMDLGNRLVVAKGEGREWDGLGIRGS